MISHEHRCIFVHIPKTAGNSINRVFGVGWQDHKDLQRYFDELPHEISTTYFKFAIVRNPWDRLLSDYNYQVKKSRATASKLFVFAADGSKRDFAAWAETALGAPDRYAAGDWGGAVSPHIHRWSPQVDWISIDGEVRTDFVARIERLPEDFRVVRRQLHLPPVRLPHRNRRLHWHYSHYYDRTTRELVASYYARDIAEFGYEFENAFLRLAFNWPGATRAANGGDVAPPADGASCSVSFATPRPRVRPPLWRRHPSIAALAGFAISLGLFGLSALAAPRATDPTVAATTAQQSVRRLLVRASAPSRAAEDLLDRARRLSRTISELDLSVDFLPAAAPSGIVMVSLGTSDNATGLGSTGAPANSRASSGGAPRWWWRRHRGDPN
jgi:hypothetical protein